MRTLLQGYPPELGVRIDADIDPVRMQSRKIVASVLLGQQWPVSDVENLVFQAQQINPACLPKLDCSTPWENAANLHGAITQYVLMPQGVFEVNAHPYQRGRVPCFVEADLKGGWKEHNNPYGSSIWTGELAWRDQGTSGLSWYNFALIDRTFLRDKTYQRLQSMCLPDANPFYKKLFPLLKTKPRERIVEDYMDSVTYDEVLSEEIEHCFDECAETSFREKYNIPDPGAAKLRLLLSPGHRLKELWNAYINDAEATATIEKIATELSGKLGSARKRLRGLIADGHFDQAWIAFLSVMGEWEDMRKPVNANPHAQLVLENAYPLTAQRIIGQMQDKATAQEILEECAAAQSHPASVALTLNEKSCGHNLRDTADRFQLLSTVE